MGVGGVGFAVGGPAGVGDAYGAGDVFAFAGGFEGGHFAFGFVDGEHAFVVDHGDAGAVIAAVFQTM